MSSDSILGLWNSFCHLAVPASLKYQPMNFKLALMDDCLCSSKLYKLRETASMLEHGIWGYLSLCSQVMVTQSGSRTYFELGKKVPTLVDMFLVCFQRTWCRYLVCFLWKHSSLDCLACCLPSALESQFRFWLISLFSEISFDFGTLKAFWFLF